MKNLIKKWLGICAHASWETIGNVMTDLEGGEMVVERCAKCSKTVLFKI